MLKENFAQQQAQTETDFIAQREQVSQNNGLNLDLGRLPLQVILHCNNFLLKTGVLQKHIMSLAKQSWKRLFPWTIFQNTV